MNYLDYFIIGFIVLYSIWGLSKGLLKIVLDFVGYVVAFIMAKMFGSTLLEFVNGTSLYGNLQGRLFETFNKLSPDLSRSIETLSIPDNIDALIAKEPGLAKIFENYPKLLESIETNISKLSGKGFMDVITEYVLLILCVVTIFIVVKIIFSIIVSVILSRRDSFPLAFTNRLLGMGFGLLISLLILSFVFQIAEVFSLTTSPVLANAIAKSQYGHWFTSIPILEWISNFIKK